MRQRRRRNPCLRGEKNPNQNKQKRHFSGKLGEINFNVCSARPWLPYTHRIHSGSSLNVSIDTPFSSLTNRKTGIQITFEGFDNTKTSSTTFWFLSTILESIMYYLFLKLSSPQQAEEIFGSSLSFCCDKTFQRQRHVLPISKNSCPH